MKTEVTATSAPGYQLPALQQIGDSVSAFDPDRDVVQLQSSASNSFPESRPIAMKARPKTGERFLIAFGQVHRIRPPSNRWETESGRDATIAVDEFPDSIVYVPVVTSTGDSVGPASGAEADPWREYTAALEEKERRAQQVRQAYDARIDMLRMAAAAEEIEMNEASVNDFWSFIGSAHFSRQAGLALMENGNVRAVWKGEEDSHLGLHFLGEQQVQYVIFKRRPGSSRTSRTAGRDSFDGVRRQIGAFDLDSLVSA